MSKKLVIAIVIVVIVVLGFYIYNSSAKAGVSGNVVSTEWCNGADINKDGVVAIGDLTLVSDNYGRSDCSVANSWCNGADLNRDGKVTIGDMSLVSENYGKTGCVSSGGVAPTSVSCKAGSGCFVLAELSYTSNESDTGGTNNDQAEFIDYVKRDTYKTTWIADGSGIVNIAGLSHNVRMFGSSIYASDERLVGFYPPSGANNISSQNVSVRGIVLSKQFSSISCPVAEAKCVNGLRLINITTRTGRPEFSANLTFVDIVDGRPYKIQVPTKLNYTYLSYKGVNYPVRYNYRIPGGNVIAPLGGQVEFNSNSFVGASYIKTVPRDQHIFVGGVAVVPN